MTDDDGLDTAGVCAELGVTPQIVKGWRDDGMPAKRVGRGFRYSGDAVRAWLLDRGVADEGTDADVLRTTKEIAARYGVSARTVRDWHNEPKFPGRPGHYPVSALDLWVTLRPQLVGAADNDIDRRESERARIELYERRIREKDLHIAKFMGELVPLDLVLEWIEMKVAASSANLDEIPASVMQVIPQVGQVVENETRAKVYRLVSQIITEAKRFLKQLPDQRVGTGDDQ